MIKKKKRKRKDQVGDVTFGGKRLKDYSKKELIRILETFLQVNPFKEKL